MPKKDEKTVTRDDIDAKEMVFCMPMKTYVPLAFCLNGGPMNAKGKCKWFIKFETYPPDRPNGDPIKDVVHNYPTRQRVERHIKMQKTSNIIQLGSHKKA